METGKSAKGADARRQTTKELADSLGGALDTAPFCACSSKAIVAGEISRPQSLLPVWMVYRTTGCGTTCALRAILAEAIENTNTITPMQRLLTKRPLLPVYP